MFQQVLATKQKQLNKSQEPVSPLQAAAKDGEHRRGVSETEFLLNQIRHNINTLKAY